MPTILTFDSSVYCLEAVQKAAYRFIDRLTVVIRQEGGNAVCEIEAIPGRNIDWDSVLADFKRELLDQQLRTKIKAETEPARNLILAYAFSRTGLQA